MPDENANIQVEITDAREFHCFRLVLNPKFEECQNCEGKGYEVGDRGVHEQEPETYTCDVCRGIGKLPVAGSGIEIMLHARSVVDLIHKLSLALCDWQTQTSARLIDHLKNLEHLER